MKTLEDFQLTRYHFRYSGECVIESNSYEEARQQISQSLRGIYSYHQIQPTCSMLATPSEIFTDDEDD